MKLDRHILLLPVACVALASFVSSSAHAATILFVGAGATATGTDATIITRLQSTLGHTVTYVNAVDSTTASANGQNAVIISSSIASGDVAAKFANVTAGVMNWENAIQQQSRMNYLTETAGRGTVTGQTQITITTTGAASPLAGGLAAGTYTVSTSQEFSFGAPGGLGTGGTSVGLLGDGLLTNLDRSGIYGYETGGLRPDGTASQGRRVHFFMTDTTFGALNDTGLRLFDASVAYVVPEPSSAALAGIALVSLGFRRRRVGA